MSGARTNAALFRSVHAAAATAFATTAVGMMLWRGASIGRGAGSDRLFLLLTGWAALALFLVVMAYVLRKYAHKGRYSPELRMAVPIETLERVERRLDELRSKILARSFTARDEIEAEARRILEEERVTRVLRAQILEGEGAGPPFLVRTRWTEPLGRVARWLHAHLYYGLAGFVLVALHAGIGIASPLGWLLALGTLVVVLTGVWGIATWARGPTWLTRKERELGISIEMAHGLAGSLEREVAAALERADEGTRAILRDVRRARSDLHERSRLALQELEHGRAPDAIGDVRDALVLIGQERRVRDRLRQLARVRRRMMGWRVVHVPIAWFLFGAVLLHVLSVWRY